MIDTTANNKRIVKNTLFLYGRMLLMMLINLYTSRVILNVLGVVDYGIYNVVGGFVSMFSVLRSGLVSATQRFITFELGRDDKNALQETYSSSMHIYIMVSILIVIVAETIGIWFIENKMIIPSDRIYAAHWVYQFSLLSLIIGLICNPQNALIIAHERMSVFAYISIYEAISKLVIVYLLTIGDVDKLILYSIFMCVIQLSLRLIY
ncbi:MAG: lipopolysaccharide biosynthesis protein, partial [Paludibacteraceae bacterium]|nr:lipopolysaccharide biosynthesis protein [Paludibacteraceae bacterium]